jgi:hypothetical protein
MLQFENKSPFAVAMSLLPNRDGIDTLFIVVKATFDLVPRLAVAEKQVPVVMADEYWGDPAQSSVKYGAELHLGKPGTDVVLVGQAWAPQKRAVAEGGVMLRVADRKKTIVVVGDRVWRGSSPSTPTPFVSIPLVYERAYGGSQLVGDRLYCEERNPVGVGFVGKRSKSDLAGQPVPNLEDLNKRISSLGDVVPPACLGFIAPSWQSRRQYAGTYDETWQKKRAPYLPKDFDLRYFHAAAQEFVFPQPLVGGESVTVAGAAPEGPMAFELPKCRLDLQITLAGKKQTPSPPSLETVLIEPDDNRVCLSWRSQLACDKQPLKVEKVHVNVAELNLNPKAVR